MHHLDLKENHLLAAKLEADIYYAGSNSYGASSSKRKPLNRYNKWKGKGASSSYNKPKPNQHEKRKHYFNKKMSKMKYYNCGKKSHYTRNCGESKKLYTLCIF